MERLGTFFEKSGTVLGKIFKYFAILLLIGFTLKAINVFVFDGMWLKPEGNATNYEYQCNKDGFIKMRAKKHWDFEVYRIYGTDKAPDWAKEIDPNAIMRCEFEAVDSNGAFLGYYLEKKSDGTYSAYYFLYDKKKLELNDKSGLQKGQLF